MSCEAPFPSTHRTNTSTYAVLVHKLMGFISRLCFRSTKESALSSASAAVFYSASPSLSLTHTFPSPPHVIHSRFLQPSPLYPCPPSPHLFQPLHPFMCNGSDNSYWLRRQNQRNGQPISFQAKRVTIIHEAVQLLRRPQPCHVCICDALPCPCTFAAHFHCT